MRFLMAIFAGVLLLAGCSSDQTTRDDDGEIIEGGELGVFAVQQGDCILFPDEDGDVESFEAVSCDEPHDGEIYQLFNIEGYEEFPGESVISSDAQAGCRAAFEPFVGIDYDSSQYFFTFLSPSEATWDGVDDREVICIITTADGEPQLTGSLEGAAS